MTKTTSNTENNKCCGITSCQLPSCIGKMSHWFLRIAIASVFIFHGVDKFPKIDMVAQMLDLPPLLVTIIAILEVAGGLFILLAPLVPKDSIKGMLTRLGALMLIPIIIAAIGMVHWGQWTFMATETHKMGGMEFQFTLLMILLFLFARGKNV